MEKGKVSLLNKEINKFGLFYGFKVWFFICTQGKLGKRIYTVHNKKLGKDPFFLRNRSSDDYIAGSILKKNGGYDFLFNIQDIIKSSNYILDGGANIGIFTRIVKNINPNVNIIAVELEKGNYEMIKRNCIVSDGVTIILGGLWNKDETLQIIDCEEGNECAFKARTGETGDLLNVSQGYKVSTIMNKYNIDKWDIVKLDIEGSEYELFDETSKEWIPKVNMLIIEIHEQSRKGCEERVYKVMNEYGFKSVKYDENVIFLGTKLIWCCSK